MVAHLLTTLTVGAVTEVFQHQIKTIGKSTTGIDDTCIHTEVALCTCTYHQTTINLGTVDDILHLFDRLQFGTLGLRALRLFTAIDVLTIQEIHDSLWRIRQYTIIRQLITQTEIHVCPKVCPRSKGIFLLSCLEVDERQLTTLLIGRLTDIQMPLRATALVHRDFEVKSCLKTTAGFEGLILLTLISLSTLAFLLIGSQVAKSLLHSFSCLEGLACQLFHFVLHLRVERGTTAGCHVNLNILLGIVDVCQLTLGIDHTLTTR